MVFCAQEDWTPTDYFFPRSGPTRVDQRPLTFVPSHNSLTKRSDEPEHAVDRLLDPTPSSTRTPTGVRYGVGYCG